VVPRIPWQYRPRLQLSSTGRQPNDGPGSALASTAFFPMSHFKAVDAAFMERTPFAIDDAGDHDDDSDLDMVHGEDDDDQVLDEVSGFRNRGIFDDAQCAR
jgi:hypothetical protein